MDTLLNFLVTTVGCSYLSDLPFTYKGKLSSDLILSIEDEMFPLSQWIDTISYLLQQEHTFASIPEAKQFLCEHLQ